MRPKPKVTVDIGLPLAVDARWGGGEVFCYDDSGRIREVGIENLCGESDFDPSVGGWVGVYPEGAPHHTRCSPDCR